MTKKQPVMKCLKCGNVLALLGEQGEGIFAIDKDASKRFKTEKGERYITCKFCGAKNGFVRNNKLGLPRMRLTHIIE